MKKITINLMLLFVIIIIFLIITLSTIGIETNKFNKFLSDKISQERNINLELETIKFKIDAKKLSLFLETQNPKVLYRDIVVPIENIKLYIDFFSLLKSDTKIEKINLVLKELDIAQLNKLSIIIKPSNFKSLLNNKIKQGKIVSEIEIFLTEKGKLKNFIAKGSVKELKAELLKDLNLKKTTLEFFADKDDILIKNIFGQLEDVQISNGDLKLNLENGIRISSNFNSKLNFDKKVFNKYIKFLNKFEFVNNIQSLKANLNSNLSVYLDKTYKIKDYNYDISGKIEKGRIELLNPIKNKIITEGIKSIYLSDFEIKTVFKEKNINLKGDGKYSFNDSDYQKVSLENNFKDNQSNLKINFDYGNKLEFGLINYEKPKNSIASIFLDFEKKKNSFKVNQLTIKEINNLIKISSLEFKKNKFITFKEIKVSTDNNDFLIQNRNKILIKGNNFDATNLVKYFNDQSSENQFKEVNSLIEIDFKNIKVPMSEALQNFKLIGEVKKGQFVKITSKGDFGGNNFLDISMKKDKNTNKKYLEVYSDLTRPLLTEYNFFKGLSGGKLLFTSIIEGNKSNSKLKIENFKVVNAPGVIKLLSLADLGGLADLAKGEGLSFDLLEINMEKNKKFLSLTEILALGPSISVLMEGYQDENGLTSMRGTLVPAKTFNKVISKIPVIGNIVIPKEVGEGLFGISFKMKGPKGKIKTTINPIRTLTPRFIQKIIDRNKIAK